jgi:hypothetical protein
MVFHKIFRVLDWINIKTSKHYTTMMIMILEICLLDWDFILDGGKE